MNLEDKLRKVRTEYLRRMTQGDNPLLQEVEAYITARQGKMLRPQLLLLASDTLGQADTPRTQSLAVCVEMLHNASLMHDDIIDHAITRRGMTSVNARWSDAVALLVGDYLLTQIMLLLSEVGEAETTTLVANTVKEMVTAELLAQEIVDKLDISDYLKIIDGKTARLFATSAQLGNPRYSPFGLHYGRLFQIYDDLRDGEAPSFSDILIRQEREAIARLQAHGDTLDLPDPATLLQ